MKTLIASSATFQSEVGAANTAAALPSVTYYSAGVPATYPRPRAFVGSAGERSIEKTSSTGWDLSGGLEFEFQRVSDPADVGDDELGFITFGEIVDAIIDEMAELSGSNGFLEVTSFTQLGDPLKWKEEFNDGTEFWNVIFNVGISGD